MSPRDGDEVIFHIAKIGGFRGGMVSILALGVFAVHRDAQRVFLLASCATPAPSRRLIRGTSIAVFYTFAAKYSLDSQIHEPKYGTRPRIQGVNFPKTKKTND